MTRLRPYAESDWETVLEICLLAFTPTCEHHGRLPATESVVHVQPDWRASIKRYLRSLTRPNEGAWLLVAETRGSVVGVVHYEVDAETQSARIGVSAVHPARQRQGIGTLMYDHVLDAMRARGVRYVTADTESNSFHAPVRRAYEKLGFVAVPVIHYFKSLAMPETAAADQKARRPRGKPRSAHSGRSRNSSGSRGGRKGR